MGQSAMQPGHYRFDDDSLRLVNAGNKAGIGLTTYLLLPQATGKGALVQR